MEKLGRLGDYMNGPDIWLNAGAYAHCARCAQCSGGRRLEYAPACPSYQFSDDAGTEAKFTAIATASGPDPGGTVTTMPRPKLKVRSISW